MGDHIEQRNVFGRNVAARVVLPQGREQRAGWVKGLVSGVVAGVIAGLLLHGVGIG